MNDSADRTTRPRTFTESSWLTWVAKVVTMRPLMETNPEVMISSQDRLEPRPAEARKRFNRIRSGGSILRLGLGKADDALAFLELTPFAEEFDTLKTLENTAAGLNAAFSFKARMLTHGLFIVGQRRFDNQFLGALSNHRFAGPQTTPQKKRLFSWRSEF